MKKTIFSLATIAMIAASCSDKDELTNEVVDPNGRESIAFSTSVNTGSASSATRAGFTGGAEYVSTYDKPTEIIARFSSKNKSTNAVRHTKTALKATYDASAELGSNWETCSDVSYKSGNDRFWDDAFGRSALLSVYAVAVPNYDEVTNNGSTLYNLVQKGTTNTANTDWQSDTETDALNSIVWKVSSTQTVGYSGTIAKEDLCYSHNIQTEKDGNTELQYGKGKDGVRSWGKYSTYPQDPKGYPKYKYEGTNADKYPTLDDGTMEFRLTNTAVGAPEDGPGHFDRGHMIFHHALTRITINLKKSLTDGFVDGQSDFTLTNPITLLTTNVNGTLNFKTGKWGSTSTGNVVMATVATPTTGYNHTNTAQIIPGYVLADGSSTNVLKFTVSDNTYYITQDQLFDALNVTGNNDTNDHNGNKKVAVVDGKITLEQGKNYIFNITVTKKRIEAITATLAPWVDVTAEATVYNDYVKIGIMDKKNTACDHFDLFRLADNPDDIYAPETGPGTGTNWEKRYNWYGNYTDKATLTQLKDASNNPTGVWKTDWFWLDNKSFYHFRTVNAGLGIQETGTANKDYVKVFGGPIQDYDATHTTISTEANDGKVNDYHWGAPYKSGASLKYDETYGWSASTDADGKIYPAIGSTSDQINIIEQHMMSNIHIILKTTKDENNTSGNKLGAGAVNLTNAKVYLTNIYNEGTVEMGRGIVNPVTTPVAPATSALTSQQQITTPSTYYKTSGDNTESNMYGYRVVPQALVRSATPSTETDLTQFIGITIVTPDDNQYYLIKRLSDIIASTVTDPDSKGNQAKDSKITRWYPGYDYTYTITISKKGIEAITCTVVDWVNVTGENINLDLED